MGGRARAAIRRSPAQRRGGWRARLLRWAALGALLAGVAPAQAGVVAPARPEPVERHFARVWRPQIEAALATADTLAFPVDPYLPEGITDGVFGYLIGLIDRRCVGQVSGDHLAWVLERSERDSRVPARLIARVARAPAASPGVAWVRARFTEPLDVGVPYSILGYHPGSLVADREITARESRLPRLHVPNPGTDGPPLIVIDEVTLFALVEGVVAIDIDGWLDALMGGRLDDTYLIGMAVFRFEGKRYGMAIGYSRDGHPRSGALDLQGDEVCFPSPRPMKAIARHLRARLVRRLALMGLPAAPAR